MKKILLAIAIIIVTLSCKKYKELKQTNDLSGKLYYSGLLQFVNNLDSPGIPHPKAGVHVQLFKKADLINFLFDSTTDNAGYFAFRNLKNGEYRLHVNTTINNIIYDEIRDISIVDDKDYIDVPWIINPTQTKQNGVVFTVVYAGGGFLNDTKIFLYSTTLLANADVNTDGTGATVKLPTTNGFGKSFALNIPALPFYVIKMKTINNIVKTDMINTGAPQLGIVTIQETIP